MWEIINGKPKRNISIKFIEIQNKHFLKKWIIKILYLIKYRIWLKHVFTHIEIDTGGYIIGIENKKIRISQWNKFVFNESLKVKEFSFPLSIKMWKDIDKFLIVSLKKQQINSELEFIQKFLSQGLRFGNISSLSIFEIINKLDKFTKSIYYETRK